MPGLAVEKKVVLDGLAGACSEKELEDLIFDFGVELDDIYEENGKAMYKFDVGANRYDLLCAEGMIRALRAYTGAETYKDISVRHGALTARKYPTHERNHVACAAIRGVSFTAESYESFIAYQDKLHQSIGRNRTLVSMGTHDLDTIDGQISYRSVDLAAHKFVPLNSAKEIGLATLKEHLGTDRKLSKYFDILSDPDRSVAFFSGDEIISLPPIINSDRTKISKSTRNIFIEVTGTDFEKVNTALKLMLYNFRGEAVESVTIQSVDERGQQTGTLETPVFHHRKYTVSVDHINQKVNLKLTGNDIKHLLEKMMYEVQVGENEVAVHCPDVRSDVLHVCDIVEDVAIAYGFNNFVKTIPAIFTIGCEDPLNKFTDKIRNEFALMGYSEALTLTLLAKADNFIDPDRQVLVSNPKSNECDSVRTSLVPGLLKAVASNLHGKIPIRMFEVADVVLLSEDVAEGATNRRMLSACIAANTSLLEGLQGPLSFLFEKCGIRNYKYVHEDRPWLLSNQAAIILVGSRAVGSIGVLHPRICEKFKIPYAASILEVDLECLYKIFMNTK